MVPCARLIAYGWPDGQRARLTAYGRPDGQRARLMAYGRQQSGRGLQKGLQNATRPRLRVARRAGGVSAGGCSLSGKKGVFQPCKHFVLYGIVRRKIGAFYFLGIMADNGAHHVRR